MKLYIGDHHYVSMKLSTNCPPILFLEFLIIALYTLTHSQCFTNSSLKPMIVIVIALHPSIATQLM